MRASDPHWAHRVKENERWNPYDIRNAAELRRTERGKLNHNPTGVKDPALDALFAEAESLIYGKENDRKVPVALRKKRRSLVQKKEITKHNAEVLKPNRIVGIKEDEAAKTIREVLEALDMNRL